MRTLTIIEFVTLDGVMQGFGSPEEDTDGGFTHGGWGAPYADESMGDAGDGLSGTSAYLFGRRTFEKMRAFWPDQPDSNPMAAHLNRTPKYVASRTLTECGWDNAQPLEGTLEDGVRALKSEGTGTIAVLGSGALVEQLLRLGLVDTYVLFVHPLLLGTGKRLFRELPEPLPLRLTSHRATGTGVLVLTYNAQAGGGQAGGGA